MAVVRKATVQRLFADKREIKRLVAEQSVLMQISDDPTATLQKAREMMLALGIRPEDNEFSRAIINARGNSRCQHCSRTRVEVNPWL